MRNFLYTKEKIDSIPDPENKDGGSAEDKEIDEDFTGFNVKKEIPTFGERLAGAEKFINSLSKKPEMWRLGGSSATGKFRPDSDLDVYALYEKEDDIPFDEIFLREDPDNGLIDGYIDFHYFAADWEVYKRNPDLLDQFKKSFENNSD